MDVLKEAQFLTQSSAPVVTNLRGIRENSIVLEDWETLLATLKDDATAEGRTLASKVQRDQTGGWRGKIYCNHRGSLSGKHQLVQEHVEPCTWSATISKQRGQAHNKMVFINFCGHHNHNMKVPDSLPEKYTSNRKGIKTHRVLQEQMTTAEITWAKNMARFTSKAHALAGTMSTWALDNGMGQVDYDRKLMWNIIAMVGGALGTKGDQMKDFIELGHGIEQKGGTFHYNLDNDNSLESFVLQTKLMQQYAHKFSDFVLIDGTHCVNRYGQVLIPTSVVDCLGKTRVTTITLAGSENAPELIQLCEKVNIFLPGTPFMTDGAPAFKLVALAFDLTHLLCIDHFRTKVFPASSGLGLASDDFKKEVGRMLYEDLGKYHNLQMQSLPLP